MKKILCLFMIVVMLCGSLASCAKPSYPVTDPVTDPVTEPVTVEGLVRNTVGVLHLELTASSVLNSVCDRCTKEFRNPKSVEYRCVLAEEKEDDKVDILVEEVEEEASEVAVEPPRRENATNRALELIHECCG